MNAAKTARYGIGDMIRIEEIAGESTTVEVVEDGGLLYFVSLLADEKETKALPVSVITFKREYKMSGARSVKESRMVMRTFLKHAGIQVHLKRWEKICEIYSAHCFRLTFPERAAHTPN